MGDYAQSLLTDEAQTEEVRRAKEIADRWELYLGNHPKPLEVKDGIDDNITPNFAGRFVDQGVSFLFGGDVVFTLDPGEQAPNETDVVTSPEEQHLVNVWRANKKRTLLPKFALNGSVAGHGFLKIVPQGEGVMPRLVNLDPAVVSVAYDEEDIEVVRAYKLQWRVMRGEVAKVRRQDVEQQPDGTWLISNFIGSLEQERRMGVVRTYWKWTPIGDPLPWDYPFPPIVDCQNLPLPNVYYGTPDLSSDVTDLNTAVSRVMSNLARIIRFHSHPKTVFKGVTEGQVNVNTDGAIYLPDGETQDVSNLEMASDLSAALTVYREVYDALHEVGRRPKIAAGKLDNIGQLSGLAIKILYGPLTEVTHTKQGPYGDCLNELNKRLLVLAGFGDYAAAPDTTVHWPEMVPRDPLEEAQAGVLENEMGVSKATWLERHGYNSRTEKARRAAEADAAIEASAAAFDRGANLAP